MFLIAALYSMVGTTLAGILIVLSLTMGFTTLMPIVYAAIAGFLIAIPVVWIVAAKIRAA
ncbi:MAG: CTP synthetase [Maritimibacter sp.]